MTSQVVKDLQQLHLRSRLIGLEDVLQPVPPPAAGLGLAAGLVAPVSPICSPFRRKIQSESENTDDGKSKSQAIESYFYRSPCPERLAVRRSPAKRAISPQLGLTEKAALFCKENTIDGFGCKVFVGNVSYRASDAELREFFTFFGKVLRANVCKDRKTKRSRGYVFCSLFKKQRNNCYKIFSNFLNQKYLVLPSAIRCTINAK